jgi:hypothetical protein
MVASTVVLTTLAIRAQVSVSGTFFTEDWESGAKTQSFNSQSYGNANGPQLLLQSSFTGSGRYALQHQLTAGLAPSAIAYATQHVGDSIAGPVLAAGRGSHFSDLYIQYKVAYSAGFDMGTGYKQLIIGTQDDRRHDDPCCNPWVAHYLTIYPAHPNMRGLLAEANNKQTAAPGQWVGFTQNASGYSQANQFVMQTGRFYTVEVRRRLNDLGSDNGIFQMWVDGVLLSDYRNVRYRVRYNGTYGSNDPWGTNFVMISDYSSTAPTRNQSIYYDDVKFSTTYIDPGSTATPPAAPTSLRIVLN